MSKNENSLYINGTWQQGASTIKNENPSDLSFSLGYFPQASQSQLQQAIDSARTAQPLWEKTTLETKQQKLNDIGQALKDRADELGKLLASEEGKPFLEARGEIYRSGQFFQYYAAEVLRNMGEMADSVRPGVGIEVSREARGVIGVISPWNFPMATAAWKIAPALAYGNAVIWKPANLTPASAVALARIIDQQGLPPGTFNLVLGSGSQIGDQLINSDQINGISFTGSVETGRRVAVATASNLIPCQLEMGSKNALVIAEDADIEIAVQASIAGAFSGTGQKCTASSRLIVDKKIYGAYLDALLEKINSLKVGHALAEGTEIGPVASLEQLQSNQKWVERGKSLGAEILAGDKQVDVSYQGYYMAPVLFANTQNNWDLNQEELFAPIACVICADDLDHAIALTNDTRFGLTAGIVTQSLKTSALFKQQAKSGCVMVNLPTAGTDYHVPFGGRKQSSLGAREQGQYAKEFYTIVKTSYQRAY